MTFTHNQILQEAHHVPIFTNAENFFTGTLMGLTPLRRRRDLAPDI